MNKRAMLKSLSDLYNQNTNIIAYLKEKNGKSLNNLEDIAISYDLQAGSYSAAYYTNPKKRLDFLQRLIQIVEGLVDDGCKSLFEGGVGEATSFLPLYSTKLNDSLIWRGGCDISWSRIRRGIKFAEELRPGYEKTYNLIMGDLFSIPLEDDSVDIIYTVHAMEPNGGKEKEILRELYRAARKYVVLIEPAFDFANTEQKDRMRDNGYVQYIKESADELGYKLLCHELYGTNLNSKNPSGITIIKKECNNSYDLSHSPIACPVTKHSLKRYSNCYYSKDSMLVYPIIDGVPCLLMENAVIASHFLEYNHI